MDQKLDNTPVDQIPGIGIIRARALKKAGWPTIASLRTATVEDLIVVPGITEIKAAQILQYVQSLKPDSASRNGSDGPVELRSDTALSMPPADTEQPTEEPIEVTFSEPSSTESRVRVYSINSPRDLMQDLALSAQLLLTSEFSGKWERPFAIQLGKLISLHEKWDRYEPLGKKQSKQVMDLLEKIYRLLTETPVADLTKRKSQERYAELIRDRRRRIRDLLERK